MPDEPLGLAAAIRQLSQEIERFYGVHAHRVEVYFDHDPKPISLPVPRKEPPGEEGRPVLRRAEPEGCAGDVLRVLRETATRLTCPQILDELAERNLEWSERTVRRWLAWLQEQKWIDLDERAQPPGYGLA